MAGHSKWANIKHKKERADAKRGKIFSRIVKEIISAVKVSGSDSQGNPRLKLAIQKAKAANMPNENIERAIKKASDTDTQNFTEITYELYGHGGVGIIAEVMTDNKNRIASEIRYIAQKHGGNISSPGAVAFNFDRKGIIYIAKEGKSEEEVFSAATENGAEDFDTTEDAYIIITAPENLYSIKDQLEESGIKCTDPSIEMIPKTTIECDLETKEANIKLIEKLEELDDVDTTFNNAS